MRRILFALSSYIFLGSKSTADGFIINAKSDGRRSLLEATSNNPLRDGGEELVQVYDNVFSSSACNFLHELAQDHNERTNGGDGSIFKRPSAKNGDSDETEDPFPSSSSSASSSSSITATTTTTSLSPLEQAIHSALIELGDDSDCMVEYWSRDEHNNMDVHADIDEEMLEEDDIIRCPMIGHVLYLYINEDRFIGQCPTCVFPEKNFGWRTQVDDQEATNTPKKTTEMVIVPAVQGRILRFKGSAMHAVPKPATRWLHSVSEQKSFYDDDDDDYTYWDDFEDDDDDDDKFEFDNDDVERSVLLFNTWPKDEPPPRGVDPDYATGSLPDGIEIDDDDDAEKEEEPEHIATRTNESNMASVWAEEYGTHGEKVCCNPRDQWKTVAIKNVIQASNKVPDRSASKPIHISLMGNKSRRLHATKFVPLYFPDEVAIEAALHETNIPSSVCLNFQNDGEE